ncbi:MAG: DUF2510 domain-containing protein [Demequinaceae bacterium]|nr:DUF2510 domain-containing protein [Demequinaceae bacterium]
MAETPMAGWYADPENAERLRYWDGTSWTGQIRAATKGDGADAPRRRLSGLAIIGIVAAALVTIAGFTAIILNAGGESTPAPPASPSHTPPVTPDATRTAPAVAAPEGWEVYISRSGAFEYAYDPEWTDVWTPSYELMLLGAVELEDVDMEVAGSWILDGSPMTGETNLIVIATSDGTEVPGFMEIQAEAFARSNAASIESDDYTSILSEELVMANGYDAWRIDYTMTAYDLPFTASVVAFRHETTIGFIYVVSLKDFDSWLPDFLTLVDSFVVVKPPESP